MTDIQESKPAIVPPSDFKDGVARVSFYNLTQEFKGFRQREQGMLARIGILERDIQTLREMIATQQGGSNEKEEG